jgi:NADPH-dependent ferric siderophore reductase
MKSPPKRNAARHSRSGQQGDRCDLRFRIDLMGVRSENARRVRPGDVLEVFLVRDGLLRAVICQSDRGERVGALSAFPGLARLIECLEEGVQYSALVEKSSAQSCSVFVSRSE